MTARLRCLTPMLLALFVLASATAITDHGSLPSSTVFAQGPTGPGGPQLDYRLADTWTKQSWSLRPGFFNSPTDVTTTPDGTRHVLEHYRKVIHHLAPDDVTWTVSLLPSTIEHRGDVRAYSLLRIDASPDGLVGVLAHVSQVTRGNATLAGEYLVLQADEAGSWNVTHAAPEEPSRSYVDLALDDSDMVFLARYASSAYLDQTSVDILSPIGQGSSLTRIAPPELGHAYAIDVHRDGTIFALSRVSNITRPVSPPRTPRPTSTPRPSVHEAAVRGAPASGNREDGVHGVEQSGVGIRGLLVIGPDGRVRDTWADSGLYDVAVHASAAVVVKNGNVYDVSRRRQLVDPQREHPYGVSLERIAVRADGLLTAITSTEDFRGLIEFAYEGAGTPYASTFRGSMDDPFMRGPSWPRRVAVDDTNGEVLVVDGELRFGSEHHAKGGPSVGRNEDASLLRFRADGLLWSENGVPEHPWDVAAAGGMAVTSAWQSIVGRRDRFVPRWYGNFNLRTAGLTTLLTSIDAHDDRIAALDIGHERVLWLDRDAQLLAEWSTWLAHPNALPSDIAVHGDRVYLADLGRNRVMVRGGRGGDLGEWPTHDGPLRIATGPHGDVFVLGRGGWLLRYTPDGELVAWWRIPHRTVDRVERVVTPGDLDVGPDGRVYATWWVEGPKDTVIDGQAGIDIFEPYMRPAADARPPLLPGACLAETDKKASPERVTIGETVEVQLTMRGECPGTHRPGQIMIVFDRSLSMSWDGALPRALDAVVGLLDTLDGEAIEVGLVSFSDGASLELPLTDRLGAIRGRIASFSAGGDTLMAAGIELAHRELMGERRDPDAEGRIWVVSDGVFKDAPTEVVEAARADGIALDSLVFRNREYDNDVRDALRALFLPQHLFEELRPGREIDIVRAISGYEPQLGLFDTVTIDDEIPANMRLLEHTIRPPAARVDNTTLRWTHLDVVAANALTMTYSLEPLELGIHPTNVRAEARWLDAWGHAGRQAFPVPEVEVVTPPPTPTPTATPEIYQIWLPFTSRMRCHRRPPVDVVLTVDTSGSMGRPVVGQPGTALDVARTAMREAMLLLDMPRDRVAVVEFNDRARIIQEMTGDTNAVLRAIDALAHSPGSRLDQGLALATHAIDQSTGPRGRPVVILLTDGLQAEGRKIAIAWSNAVRGRGISVYAVGFGPTIDEDLLRRMASTPDRYHRSIGAHDLMPIYGRILAELACPGG